AGSSAVLFSWSSCRFSDHDGAPFALEVNFCRALHFAGLDLLDLFDLTQRRPYVAEHELMLAHEARDGGVRGEAHVNLGAQLVLHALELLARDPAAHHFGHFAVDHVYGFFGLLARLAGEAHVEEARILRGVRARAHVDAKPFVHERAVEARR